MNKPSMYIKGIDKLEAEMNKIHKALDEGKVRILKEAGQFIKEGIDRNIAVNLKKKTGRLGRATYVVALPSTIRFPARAYVGIRQGRAPHAHLVELGHNITKTKKGPVLGQVAAHPFFWPAVDERKGPALDMIESSLGKTITGSI